MNQVVKVALQADVGGFVRNFASADNAVGKVGASIEGITNVAKAGAGAIDAMGDAVRKMALKVMAGGAAMTAAFGKTVKDAAALQSSMNNVGSIMDDQNRRQLPAYTNAILKMSRSGYQDAVTLANGFYDIASSGYAGADGLKILDASQKAATAGLTNTATAGKAITSVINAYGHSANMAKADSDVLFQAVNVGVFTFEELANSMGDVIGSASQSGVSISEMTGALAAMTLSGINADEASTSLNRVIQSFIKPSEAMETQLRSLGYASGQQALQQDGLVRVMERLRISAHGNMQTLASWFQDIRGMRGALALFANDGKNYARVMDQMNDATKGQGATQRALEQQSKSISMQWQQFVNNLKAAGIEIGLRIIPMLTPLLHMITALVGAFADLPGPIKELIAIGGSLASVLLTIGAALVAWKAKSIVTGWLLNQLGTGFVTLGSKARIGGAGLTSFGQRLQNSSGLMSALGIRAQVIAASFTHVGGKVSSAGQNMQGFSAKVGILGPVVSGLGLALEKTGRAGDFMKAGIMRAAGAIGYLASGMAGLITAGLGLMLMFDTAKSEAEKLAESLTKNYDPKTGKGFSVTMESIQNALKGVDDKAHKSATSFPGFMKGMLKNAADIVTNTFGQDPIKDSPWDLFFKKQKLQASETQIRQWSMNLNRNLDAVGYALKVQTGPGYEQRIQQLAAFADKFGVDLSGGFDKSKDKRQELIQDIEDMRRGAGLTVDEFNSMTNVDPEQIKALADDIAKTAESVQQSFQKSTDVFGKVEFGDKAAPIKDQLKKLFKDTTKQAEDFMGDLGKVAARGLNPQALLRLMQMPLDQAGPILRAMAEDTSGELVNMANVAEKAFSDMALRVALYARMAEMAVQAALRGDYRKQFELPTAMRIQDEIQREGSKANWRDVSKALGISEEDARKIGEDFTITLSDSLSKFEVPQLSPQSMKNFAAVEQYVYNLGLSLTHINPDQMRNLVDQVAQLGLHNPKVQELIQSLDLLPSEKTTLLRLLGKEDEQRQIRDIISDINLTPEEKITKLLAVGGPAAFAEIVRIKREDIPDKNFNVNLHGADEIQRKLDEIITRNDGRTVTIRGELVTAITESPMGFQFPGYGARKPAQGGFLKFGRGGLSSEYHTAEIARPGTMRLWAEPETGGEAYIPMAHSKRLRSSNILGEVAQQFGYGLIKMATGGQIVYGTAQHSKLAAQAATFGGWTTVGQVQFAENVKNAWQSGSVDMQQIMSQMRDDMRQFGETYAEVQEELGANTAHWLASQQLSLADFQKAAQKMIEQHQQDLDQAKEIEDNKYKLGLVSDATYAAILRRRMSEAKQYTNEWMNIKEELDKIVGQVVNPTGDVIKDRITELQALRGKPGQAVADIDKAISDLYKKMKNPPAPNWGKDFYDFFKTPYDPIGGTPSPVGQTSGKIITITITNSPTITGGTSAQEVQTGMNDSTHDLVKQLKEIVRNA